MSRHNDVVLFRHMLDHANEAIGLIKGKDRDQFKSDRVLQLALIRLIEIVGEAASKTSKEWRELHSDIPWQDIIGMRNKLIHGYDYIDIDVLWDTVQGDLPHLVEMLRDIKQNLS